MAEAKRTRAKARGKVKADGGATKADLMAQARERGVPGRSRMSKDDLARALGA